MTEPVAPFAKPVYPYKIAVLCDLRDAQNRMLLLHRAKEPNKGLYSPIGGKLDTSIGEAPARCAQREIEEEAGVFVPFDRLRLVGLISEHGFGGTTNWLMFWYRVMGPVEVAEREMNEGRLEWHAVEHVSNLQLPDTDRLVIWPLVRDHDKGGPWDEPGFFSVHIECRGPSGTEIDWRVLQ